MIGGVLAVLVVVSAVALGAKRASLAKRCARLRDDTPSVGLVSTIPVPGGLLGVHRSGGSSLRRPLDSPRGASVRSR